jgi:hypothetical protein
VNYIDRITKSGQGFHFQQSFVGSDVLPLPAIISQSGSSRVLFSTTSDNNSFVNFATDSQDFVKLYSNALATVSDKTYLENKNIVNRNRAANLTHNIHSAYYSLRGFSMFKNEMQNGRNENEYRSYADQTN